jgi:hypothetical protein
MIKYYVFEFGQLNEYDKAKVKSPFCINWGGRNRITMNNSKRIEDISTVFEFGIHSKIPLMDQIFNLESYRLLSPKLVDIILKFDDTVQIFETKNVDEKNTSIANDYKVLNFNKSIACFDWEKSIYDDEYKDYGIASHAKKIALDFEKIPKDADIFIVQELTGGVILFSEKAKLSVEKAGLTGVEFIELSKFST